MNPGGDPAGEGLRVDKWLWFARFFRTRSLASAAVKGGRVHVNGRRARPSHPLRPGDLLEASIGFDAVTVKVLSLPARRGSAAAVRGCYEETAESLARRSQAREQRRLAAMAAPQTRGRPDKHTRRELLRFQRNRGEVP